MVHITLSKRRQPNISQWVLYTALSTMKERSISIQTNISGFDYMTEEFFCRRICALFYTWVFITVAINTTKTATITNMLYFIAYVITVRSFSSPGNIKFTCDWCYQFRTRFNLLNHYDYVYVCACRVCACRVCACRVCVCMSQMLW